MSDTDLSSRIRQRRDQLGLSQEELAARMGYRSKSSITKLEKGINDLPRAKLEELAAALDTTPAWLMGLADLPCPPPGFEPLPEMARVPLVGSIACGTPITEGGMGASLTRHKSKSPGQLLLNSARIWSEAVYPSVSPSCVMTLQT